MTEKPTATKLDVAAISDRGLSNKRPVNEDSYLADEEHHLFVVADGVGGAQAGDIASQTAVEVLEDAFGHRQAGDDVEDLMEIAIQRANSSIYQMSHEHAKLSMMATTIVALHLDDAADTVRATIGHVGDSRLYRLTPDGRLRRETEDHSMVEEEVRAGRLTPEQAAVHPSRNIISRALGAEESVEVDLKTIEVEEGSSFLLCSDGITRHITDRELEALLAGDANAADVCAEMKNICYERGAEDNLTAVLIVVGPRPAKRASSDHLSTSPPQTMSDEDAERTIATARATNETPFEMTVVGAARPIASSAQASPSPYSSSRPFSKVVVTPPQTASATQQATGQTRWLRSLALLIIGAALGAIAAIYGGRMYEQRRIATIPQTTSSATATPNESAEALYESKRREVDRAPTAALAEMTRASNNAPLESSDPEFLYLYGRALLLTGKHQAAIEAFKRAVARLEQARTTETTNAPDGVDTTTNVTAARDPLKIEACISALAAAAKTNNRAALQTAARELDGVIEKQNTGTTIGTAQ